MIVGRENELSYLSGIYAREGLKTCSVLGRRGVGKSTIIEEFCKGKRHLYIQFVESSKPDNLIALNICISEFTGKEVPRYETLTEYFELLGTICREDRTILVLDEFPYIQRWMPEASSVIQRFLDRTVKHTDTMVIICGSVSSVMRAETEDMSRPLYGRFKYRLSVKPLGVGVCGAFHEGMSPEDQTSLYLTVGGIPRYQERMSGSTYEECIMDGYVLGTADMQDAGPQFIRNEIDDASMHIAAVSCIAGGSVSQKEIAEKLGLDSSYCKKILDRLEDTDIIGRVNPMFGAPKRPRYYIRDNVVAFHFCVVNRIVPMISSGALRDYTPMKHIIDTYLGQRFELLCRDFIIGQYVVKEIGRWWGRLDSEETDIDVVAKIIDGDGMTRNVFCECKHTGRKVGFGTLNTLRRRVEGLKADDPVLVLFSASGFDDDLSEYAEEGGVILIGLEHMLGKKEPPRI